MSRVRFRPTAHALGAVEDQSVKVAQLFSYIAPAAPGTRRPAQGDEAFVRPEIGFAPSWYRQCLDIDFGERWHTDVAYRRETVLLMRAELKRRFPGTRIGGIDRPDRPLDLSAATRRARPVQPGIPHMVRHCPNPRHDLR